MHRIINLFYFNSVAIIPMKEESKQDIHKAATNIAAMCH